MIFQCMYNFDLTKYTLVYVNDAVSETKITFEMVMVQ